MAARGRAALKGKERPRAAQAPPRPSASLAGAPRPLVYSAQDVARFCEVDLKTIHHWANAGKIAHHRTEGRHLRFRRNDVLHFLRAHGYPLHAALTSEKPSVFFALSPLARESDDAIDEIAKKLGARFFVRRFETALAAIAHVVSGEPDSLVVSLDDASIGGARSIAALKAEISWTAIVAITTDPSRAEDADLVLSPSELGRLPSELAKKLAVD